ncbi:MAG: hypothetical protein HOD92_13080 [Deltaproteobacteria bacterium]|nr:hypothetical protein [Deltaproteobacteria bacterium]
MKKNPLSEKTTKFWRTCKIIRRRNGLKSIYIFCNQKVGKQLYQYRLINDIENGFEFLIPFYHYFWNLRV